VLALCAMLLVALSGQMPDAGAATKTADPCQITSTVQTGSLGDAHAIEVIGSSGEACESAAGQRYKVVLCGRPSLQQNGLWNKDCGAPKACYDDVADPRHQHPEDAFATFTQAANGTTWVLTSVWCPTSSTPIPDTAALREQALRLLPTVAVGSAWTHRALIHAQTILWADTATDRTLPTVTVVGHRVQLRIHFEHATWDYGDGSTATTTSPGRAYNAQTDPCDTAQCPDYAGHTYTRTGPATITLTVSWHAQFHLDNRGTWTDIGTTPLTGPAATRELQLLQARGVLVRTPGT
jgi:hypothetical protein